MTEKLLKNYPGVEDISKQYLYELVCRDLIKRNNLKIKENAFIMPTDKKINPEETNFKKIGKEIGTAKFEIFPKSLELKDIKIVLTPATRMFEKYLSK